MEVTQLSLALLLGMGLGAGLGGSYFYARGRSRRGELDRREADAALQSARQEAEDLLRGARREAAELGNAAVQRTAEAGEAARATLEKARSEAAALREEAGALRAKAEALREEARDEARRRREEAERALTELQRERQQVGEDIAQERAALKTERQETRQAREDLKSEIERLSRRAEQLDARSERLLQQEQRADAERDALQAERHEAASALAQARETLHVTARLSPEAARETLLAQLSEELEEERAALVRAHTERTAKEAQAQGRVLLLSAMQRSASEVSAVSSVSVVPLPSDAVKGRLIGREGRNIRAFEALTGVDLIIDDTPEAVMLSSFNPLRREVAKRVLEELVQDGRVHPSRIEEMVRRAQEDMLAFVHTQGEDAAAEAGVSGLKPGLSQLLGRMYFRSSYGQNVLKHSVQVAHVCGIIAAELGLDVGLARRAGLLHDIGKSIDREIEGSHVEIGISLARRFGEGPEVLDGIAHHHDPENAETPYGVLVAAADAVSAARPGARREELEAYVRRLEQLEEIAVSFPGVQQAYAVHAGREVRVIVQPGEVTDAQATLMAREIASRVEQDMEYPGQVQVTVIRESRAVGVAR